LVSEFISLPLHTKVIEDRLEYYEKRLKKALDKGLLATKSDELESNPISGMEVASVVPTSGPSSSSVLDLVLEPAPELTREKRSLPEQPVDEKVISPLSGRSSSSQYQNLVENTNQYNDGVAGRVKRRKLE
jgi:hypothetical protein